MLILGLDPGSLHTGYGLVEKRGSALKAVVAGRFSLPPRQALAERLARLVERTHALLDEWRPEIAVLESPFHGMNSRSLIVLAQARGALLSALAGRGLEIVEYSPAEVKSAVTGNGRADKQQVARMVKLLLAASGEGWASDATDALALGICCAQRLKMDRLRALSAGPR